MQEAAEADITEGRAGTAEWGLQLHQRLELVRALGGFIEKQPAGWSNGGHSFLSSSVIVVLCSCSQFPVPGHSYGP